MENLSSPPRAAYVAYPTPRPPRVNRIARKRSQPRITTETLPIGGLIGARLVQLLEYYGDLYCLFQSAPSTKDGPLSYQLVVYWSEAHTACSPVFAVTLDGAQSPALHVTLRGLFLFDLHQILRLNVQAPQKSMSREEVDQLMNTEMASTSDDAIVSRLGSFMEAFLLRLGSRVAFETAKWQRIQDVDAAEYGSFTIGEATLLVPIITSSRRLCAIDVMTETLYRIPIPEFENMICVGHDIDGIRSCFVYCDTRIVTNGSINANALVVTTWLIDGTDMTMQTARRFNCPDTIDDIDIIQVNMDLADETCIYLSRPGAFAWKAFLTTGTIERVQDGIIATTDATGVQPTVWPRNAETNMPQRVSGQHFPSYAETCAVHEGADNTYLVYQTPQNEFIVKRYPHPESLPDNTAPLPPMADQVRRRYAMEPRNFDEKNTYGWSFMKPANTILHPYGNTLDIGKHVVDVILSCTSLAGTIIGNPNTYHRWHPFAPLIANNEHAYMLALPHAFVTHTQASTRIIATDTKQEVPFFEHESIQETLRFADDVVALPLADSQLHALVTLHRGDQCICIHLPSSTPELFPPPEPVVIKVHPSCRDLNWIGANTENTEHTIRLTDQHALLLKFSLGNVSIQLASYEVIENATFPNVVFSGKTWSAGNVTGEVSPLIGNVYTGCAGRWGVMIAGSRGLQIHDLYDTTSCRIIVLPSAIHTPYTVHPSRSFFAPSPDSILEDTERQTTHVDDANIVLFTPSDKEMDASQPSWMCLSNKQSDRNLFNFLTIASSVGSAKRTNTDTDTSPARRLRPTAMPLSMTTIGLTVLTHLGVGPRIWRYIPDDMIYFILDHLGERVFTFLVDPYHPKQIFEAVVYTLLAFVLARFRVTRLLARFLSFMSIWGIAGLIEYTHMFNMDYYPSPLLDGIVAASNFLDRSYVYAVAAPNMLGFRSPLVHAWRYGWRTYRRYFGGITINTADTLYDLITIRSKAYNPPPTPDAPTERSNRNDGNPLDLNPKTATVMLTENVTSIQDHELSNKVRATKAGVLSSNENPLDTPFLECCKYGVNIPDSLTKYEDGAILLNSNDEITHWLAKDIDGQGIVIKDCPVINRQNLIDVSYNHIKHISKDIQNDLKAVNMRLGLIGHIGYFFLLRNLYTLYINPEELMSYVAYVSAIVRSRTLETVGGVVITAIAGAAYWLATKSRSETAIDNILASDLNALTFIFNEMTEQTVSRWSRWISSFENVSRWFKTANKPSKMITVKDNAALTLLYHKRSPRNTHVTPQTQLPVALHGVPTNNNPRAQDASTDHDSAENDIVAQWLQLPTTKFDARIVAVSQTQNHIKLVLLQNSDLYAVHPVLPAQRLKWDDLKSIKFGKESEPSIALDARWCVVLTWKDDEKTQCIAGRFKNGDTIVTKYGQKTFDKPAYVFSQYNVLCGIEHGNDDNFHVYLCYMEGGSKVEKKLTVNRDIGTIEFAQFHYDENKSLKLCLLHYHNRNNRLMHIELYTDIPRAQETSTARPDQPQPANTHAATVTSETGASSSAAPMEVDSVSSPTTTPGYVEGGRGDIWKINSPPRQPPARPNNKTNTQPRRTTKRGRNIAAPIELDDSSSEQELAAIVLSEESDHDASSTTPIVYPPSRSVIIDAEPAVDMAEVDRILEEIDVDVSDGWEYDPSIEKELEKYTEGIDLDDL